MTFPYKILHKNRFSTIQSSGFPRNVLLMALLLAPFFFNLGHTSPPLREWDFIGDFNNQSYYLNHATARRSGARIQIWNLTQFKEPSYTTRGKAYQSKKTLLELDCKEKTLLVAQDTWYSKPWADGEVVFENNSNDIKAIKISKYSPSESILNAACNRR